MSLLSSVVRIWVTSLASGIFESVMPGTTRSLLSGVRLRVVLTTTEWAMNTIR